MKNTKTSYFKAVAVIVGGILVITSLSWCISVNKFSYAEVINLPLNKLLPVLKPQISKNEANLPLLKGIKFDVNNPLDVKFFIDTMSRSSVDKKETTRLIKYFLGFLTIPQEDLWVNLSPYEKDWIMPESLSALDIGKDMLLEDYLLKQLTASLTDPKTKAGKKFWQQVYQAAERIAQTRKVSVNTCYPHKAPACRTGRDFTKCVINVFNKVWIVPDIAEIYEYSVGAGSKPALNKQNKTIAFVKEASLKVMMEEDRVAYRNEKIEKRNLKFEKRNKIINQVNNEAKEIFKRDLLPIIQEQVNRSVTFAPLRQLYYALILATYCKEKMVSMPLYNAYINQAKIKLIALTNPQAKEVIYQSYINSVEKGVLTLHQGKRKYFSGGLKVGEVSQVIKVIPFSASSFLSFGSLYQIDSAFSSFSILPRKKVFIYGNTHIHPFDLLSIEDLLKLRGQELEKAVDSLLLKEADLIKSLFLASEKILELVNKKENKIAAIGVELSKEEFAPLSIERLSQELVMLVSFFSNNKIKDYNLKAAQLFLLSYGPVLSLWVQGDLKNIEIIPIDNSVFRISAFKLAEGVRQMIEKLKDSLREIGIANPSDNINILKQQVEKRLSELDASVAVFMRFSVTMQIQMISNLAQQVRECSPRREIAMFEKVRDYKRNMLVYFGKDHSEALKKCFQESSLRVDVSDLTEQRSFSSFSLPTPGGIGFNRLSLSRKVIPLKNVEQQSPDFEGFIVVNPKPRKIKNQQEIFSN